MFTKKNNKNIKNNLTMCHIVGLDEFSKNLVIQNFNSNNQLNILDLDKINDELFNNNQNIVSIDQKLNELQNYKKNKTFSKNDKEKLNFYKKKLNKLWKEEFSNILNENVSSIYTKIILIGNSNIYNNLRFMANIKSKLKYIVKINYDNHAEAIIKDNLNKYNTEIIQGNFPLDYISKKYLIKKRKLFENIYEGKGYTLQTIDKIIFTIKSNLTKHNNLNIPINLFYASTDLCKNKIFPEKGTSLYAYSDDAVAILSILQSSILVNNEIKIHENDLKTINSKVFLYKISGNKFIKYDGLQSKTYISSNYGKINKTIPIYNILQFLKTKGYHYSYI